jgi:hypothetical protein
MLHRLFSRLYILAASQKRTALPWPGRFPQLHIIIVVKKKGLVKEDRSRAAAAAQQRKALDLGREYAMVKKVRVMNRRWAQKQASGICFSIFS